ncbi:COX4 [Auxenochlorella protothecoides x Auxenochlorella symbiontica]
MASRCLRLAALVRASWTGPAVSSSAAQTQTSLVACSYKLSQAWGSAGFASTAVTDPDIEHATGPEREELEAKAKGVENPWHEAWLDAPFGTETNPVEVTSEFSERIVGVADPDDDSLVWWGTVEEGQPPKQIIEGGEFFVLKRLPSSGGHH